MSVQVNEITRLRIRINEIKKLLYTLTEVEKKKKSLYKNKNYLMN